jgi:hypothetical protein
MRDGWALVLLGFVGLGVLLVRVPRHGKWRPFFALSMALGGAGLLAGALAGVILPFVSLIQCLSLTR